MSLKFIMSLGLICLGLLSYSQENIYNSNTIPPELKKNANAVIRLEDRTINIEAINKMHIVYNRVVTVLNEKGNQFVRAAVGYDPLRKVKRIEAKIFDANGKQIKKVKKKDFIDHSAVDGGTLYTDSRVLFMAYTPISYPYTVQFTFEIETPNTAALTTWRPVSGYYLSVETSRYTINDGAGLGLRFMDKNFEDFEPVISRQGAVNSYELNNVSAIKPEDLSPGLGAITPEGMVAAKSFHYYGENGTANDWKEFGDWRIQALLKDRNEISGQTRNEIIQLVSGVTDPLEKAKLVYNYVQQNTRYISVQVGIGGLRPIKASEVDRLKYGDCKGLTNYTQALLGVAGVESYYSVVEAGRSIVDFDPNFASLEQGNHIILAIPDGDDYVWLDCTSQKLPFGFIGDFTDDRNVLVVKNGASEIVKTTGYINEENKQTTHAKVSLDEEGNLGAVVTIESLGIPYDRKFILEEEDQKDIMEYYMHYWSNINNLKIDKYNFTNDKKNVIFTEEVNVSAKKYASIQGSQMIFDVNMFNKNGFIPKRYRQRNLPLKNQRGYFDVDEFKIQIPQGMTVEAMPENVDVSNKFGTYKVEYIKQDDSIIYKRQLLIKKGTYSAEDYEAYRKFRRKIAKQDKALIILNQI